MKRLTLDNKNLSSGCIACELGVLFEELSKVPGTPAATCIINKTAPALVPSNLLYSIWTYANYMAG
jgi:hypothetical protein